MSSNSSSTPGYIRQGWSPVFDKDILTYKNRSLMNLGRNFYLSNIIIKYINRFLKIFLNNSDESKMVDTSVIFTKEIYPKILSKTSSLYAKNIDIQRDSKSEYFQWRLKNPRAVFDQSETF